MIAALLGIKAAITAGLKWATQSATHIALAIAALAILFGAFEARRAAKWEGAYHKLVAAGEKATAAQIAVNHAPAAKSAAIAEESNAQAPAYYRRVLAAADLHRVRAAPARIASNADLPRADSVAPLDDRPPAPADLVCRARAEDDQIIHAAGRAAQMRADALEWIEQGLAVRANAAPPK